VREDRSKRNNDPNLLSLPLGLGMDLGLSYIKARDSFRNLTAFDISIPLGAGCLLQAVCDITGVDCPHWFPFFASVGLSFPFLLLVQYEIERFRTVQKTSKRRLNVVVTGATKGIGKALAREFLRQGDKVFIASRSHAGVEETIRELCDQTGADPNSDIFGVSCDISRLGDVEALTEAARRDLGGRVDCWINNAGYSGSFKPFMNSDVDTIESVVKTNLLGTMYGTRAALRMFCQQEGGGHVFNMDGAGYDGKATPNYAAYGSTKAAITQMNKSLHEEAKEANKRNSENRGVGVHTLSPGMVLTDLLLEGSTVDNRASVFNILCEHPETVAHNLVPRIRYTAVKGESGKSLRYLTVQRALGYVVNWHQRNGRFFDELGNKKYSESESERLSSSLAQQTSDDLEGGEHVVAHTVNRLAFIYSFSFMGLYFMLEHAEIATAQSLF
jgi:chlorophyll(ide) b reductase